MNLSRHTDRCQNMHMYRYFDLGHRVSLDMVEVLIEEGQASGPRRGAPGEREEGSLGRRWRRWHPRPSKAARLGQDRPAFAAEQARACCGRPGPPGRYGLRPHREMSISARCSVVPGEI